MSHIRALARALGGDVVSQDQLLCPGPGHSPKDRSLSVWLISGGFRVHSYVGDDWALCKDYVRQRLGLPQWQPGDERDRRVGSSQIAAFDRTAVEFESGHRQYDADQLNRIKRARDIWNAARDPRGTLGERYLESRALMLDAAIASNVLRYHPQCPWRDEDAGTTTVPALIAPFRSLDTDEITAIQRVALTADGDKIGRRMLGIVHRCAVKFDSASTELAIGEGIETCLAARQLGHAPAWALGSVGMISKFPLVQGVTHLKILGETGEASANAIRFCGNRWYAARRTVQIVMPSLGSDLNDELMLKVAAA